MADLTLQPSRRCMDFILEFEQYRGSMYRDQAGLWTIGYGHLMTPTEQRQWRNRVMSEAQARNVFGLDLASHAQPVNRYVTAPVTQAMYDAMVSLTFNIGPGAFRNSSVLAHVNARRYAQAAQAFRLFRNVRINGRLTVSNGLVRRRAAESAMFSSEPLSEVRSSPSPSLALRLALPLAGPGERPDRVSVGTSSLLAGLGIVGLASRLRQA